MKITKKQLSKIRWGDHDELMKAIGDLLDYYHEDKFDNGYQSCLADLSVRSQLLAECITEEAKKKGCLAKKKYYLLEEDELALIIETYFRKAIVDARSE